ncbi:hypothetical protein DFR52_103183 [Hoeflea marina]|uniref:Probable membrane transporter protein n=1 Tax=Hoeflea marina TaxID=274592 RepID=A0A317PHS4_9HYPH|nr:sulfite exporter TauE/SafE family protein [Hoeflea marina]PWV99981.1 hypothetical protein DFR52_103183 [Hoeflea marina]
MPETDLLGLLGLTAPQAAVAALVLLAAGFARGYSGFGFSAVTVAGLSFVVEPALAVPVAVLLEVAASILQGRSIWRDIDWKLAGALLAGGLAGNPAGVLLLAIADPSTLRLAVYGFVAAVCLVLFLVPPVPRNLSLAAWLGVGLIAGAINGAMALSGLFIVTVMTLSATPPFRIRATLVAYFFLSDIYAGVLLAGGGLIGRQTLLLVLCALPLVAVGIVLGSRRFLAASDAGFRRATLILLLCIAVSGIIRLILTS